MLVLQLVKGLIKVAINNYVQPCMDLIIAIVIMIITRH